MKIGIMQPYFIPYIGYWQLINAVDKYVVYDDVNFIKGGWINRNRILIGGQVKYFNVPMVGASSNKLINEVEVNNNEKIIAKNLRIIESAYKKAPFYNEVLPVIEKILKSNETNLALYIYSSLYEICKYLDIKTELILSSKLKKDNQLKAQDKVLAICKMLKATEYYNTIAGSDLYKDSVFQENGILLKFLQPQSIKYKQFDNVFVDNLSIIDIMMFNSKETVQSMLNMYSTVTGF